MNVKQFTNIPKSFSALPAVMTMAEACNTLRVCDTTVVKLIRHGKIKGNRAGKQWFIDKESVQKFVKGEI